jgi:hypothetical protein
MSDPPAPDPTPDTHTALEGPRPDRNEAVLNEGNDTS